MNPSVAAPLTGMAKNRLVGLTKELTADWAGTKDAWRDAKAIEFEKKYIEELIAGVNAAVTNLDALERVLNQVRNDCK
jgi:hypothetical protein